MSSPNNPITVIPQPIAAREGYEYRKKQSSSSAATGASAAGIRAISAQFVAFYFRAPAKMFFRSRVDYTAFARAINPAVQAGQGWSWRTSTPGLLAYAVRKHGWRFIPDQVLPPMLANVSIGAVLYTSYLQCLGAFHEPSAQATKRTFPPPNPQHTFAAGFVAGSIQSVFAAPLDALQVRFSTNEMLEGKYRNMWHYSAAKLRSIGPQGVFGGWTLSFIKDSFGAALFFSTFEYVKAQLFYNFLTRYYEFSTSSQPFMSLLSLNDELEGEYDQGFRPVIKPNYMIEPTFIALAGIGASISQQLVQYPLTTVQNIHFSRLEAIDHAAKLEGSTKSTLQLYIRAYEHTFAQCRTQAAKTGGLLRWLYRGFFWNTIRQVPSTSAGLIVFEIIRRKYADSSDIVRIQKDGYDILLT